MSADLSPAIAGAVVVHASRLLLIRRRVAVGPLSWSLPSGKVDPGESPADAAAREALEEASVVVAPLQLLGERVHPATGWRVVYVACRLVSGAARAASPREVAEVRWVSGAEIPGLIPDGLYRPVQEYLDSVLP